MKKIKYFLRKNFKKFLVLLSVFVIAFSCFVVSVSATTSFNVSYTQPIVDDKSGYIEIFLADNSGKVKGVQVWSFNIVGGNEYDLSKPFIYISYLNSTTVIAEIFRVSSDTAEITPLIANFSQFSSLGTTSSVGYDSSLGDSFTRQCTIPSGYKVSFIRTYGICVRSPENGPYNYFSSNSDFVVSYGSDALINNKLDILIEHLTDYQSEITESIQQGNQQVINNANQNTDKILNSGEYTLDMGDSTVRLESVEKSLFDNANLGNVADSIFDSSTWIIDLSPSILSSGIILDELLNFGGVNYTWFMTVARFGLLIGCLALILAIVPRVLDKGGKK